MAAHSSLTTSRLAALSLSPSRIAQLGVKHDSRGSSENGDGSSDGGKDRSRSKSAGKGKDNEGSDEGKNGMLSVPRPEMERRSSTLDSLSDEDDDPEGNAAGTKDMSNTGGQQLKAGESVESGSAKEDTTIQLEPTRGTPSVEPSALPETNIAKTSDASSSRQRSPPPSYDFAILPSALHQSASATTPRTHGQGEDAEPMSARRRGKQRDMRDSEHEDGAGRGEGRGSGTMLELLENSDTSEAEEFSIQTSRPSPPHPSRRNEDRHPLRQDRAKPSALLAPQLGKPSTARRKHPAILKSTTRSRSSYTGPVEMIDRSGEGWAESIVDEDITPVVEGYDISSTPDTPTRPVLVSGASSFIRALPSPSSGAFTQDARILGWKIVGGRSKFPRDGEVRGRGLWSDTGMGREHDSGVEDAQKPGLGAYVGMLFSCLSDERR